MSTRTREVLPAQSMATWFPAKSAVRDGLASRAAAGAPILQWRAGRVPSPPTGPCAGRSPGSPAPRTGPAGAHVPTSCGAPRRPEPRLEGDASPMTPVSSPRYRSAPTTVITSWWRDRGGLVR